MKKKLSFSQIRQAVEQLIIKTKKDAWVRETYKDHVIYELKDKYYKQAYSLDEKGTVSLTGDPVEVEMEYVPVQAACKLLAAAKKDSKEYGYKWDVVIIAPGVTTDGHADYPAEALKTAVPLYEGAQVFAVSEAQHTMHNFGKSVRDIIGWLSSVSYKEGVGLVGKLNIMQTASWLRDILVESWEAGKKDLLGLSHDIRGKFKKTDGGRKVKVLEIKSVTVDVVYQPIGGGQFTRMAAAKNNNNNLIKEGKNMLEAFLQLLAALNNEAYLKIKDKKDLKLEDVTPLVAAAMKPNEGHTIVPVADTIDLSDQIKAAVQEALKGAGVEETQKSVQLLACKLQLDKELTSSKLPNQSQARMQKMFEGKVFKDDELQAAIKEEKEYVDSLTGSGKPEGVGGTLQTGVEEPDRLQAAMDILFKVPVKDELRNVSRFKGIRDAYVQLTGDVDISGRLAASHQRLTAAFSSNTFSFALGNTMYRRLTKDYREFDDYGVSRLISSRRNAKDFRNLEAIRIDYFGDLPDITPETDPYPDLGTLSDEKVEYALNQKGGTVTISRKMIINDDMALVMKITGRLPRASRRTLAKRVWNLFITNSTYKGDSKAVFHADHNNLVTVALAYDKVDDGDKAMYKQTEPGSGEPIGAGMKILAIPRDLKATAHTINQSRLVPGSTDHDANPVFQMFGANNENIVIVPFMSDANDWYGFADPNEVEICELAFLNGQEEPEMFVADNPNSGLLFTDDKMQYKIRHEYEAAIIDYRGVYKAVVA